MPAPSQASVRTMQWTPIMCVVVPIIRRIRFQKAGGKSRLVKSVEEFLQAPKRWLLEKNTKDAAEAWITCPPITTVLLSMPGCVLELSLRTIARHEHHAA